MSTLEYHLAELAIAKAKDDPRRVMPTLPDNFGSILDLGCGAGQTLIACDLQPGVFACGADIDEEALRYGHQLRQQASNPINFVRAGGEALPFAAQTFDVVISRVAIPYMHIPTALDEIARVLKPGGHVWFTLHPIALVWKWLWNALRKGNLKGVIYQSYTLMNGLLLHCFGKQVRFPLNRARCESFQTERSITRAMQAAGFTRVETQLNDQIFVVRAVKA
jgi:ubiquinone/menaquinone biosynthesis C-methylase UbiE